MMTGCFEILEETKVNANGSGSHSLKVNMSQSKMKLASIMELDSIQGHKVPQEVDIVKHLNTIKRSLEETEGISNARIKYDFDEFIFGVSYDYENITSMKDAIWKMAKKGKAKSKDSILIYQSTSFAKNTFKRTLGVDFLNAFNQLKEEDKSVIKDASYTWIGRFEQEIIKSSNANTKISKSKHAFMLKSKLSDIIFGTNSIENTVVLKE
jgi:hypothetical protein